MKKFSKLLAVLVALAVIICPMTSAIVANATANGGTYSIVAEDANNVVLTIGSNDGFIVYQATVTFNNDSAFQSSYGSEGYTNGLKVIDYSLVSGSKDNYNAPAISAQQNGSSLVILVSATDAATLDLYSEVQIGIRVASGSTANLAKIQAADEGTIEEDPSLLNFGAKVAADGTVDTQNNDDATTGIAHTHNYTKTTPYEVSAPTCTAYGVYRKTCETCGALDPSGTYTGTVMADHTPSNVQNATADFLASDATCTEPASYYYECTVCHAAIEEGMAGYTGTFTSGSALGHNMTMHSANAATCTTAGNTQYYSCDRCNKYFSDAAGNTEIAANSWNIAATGHTPVTIPAVAATCTTAGSTAGTKCSVCNEILTAPTPIAALGHNMTPHAAVAATCTTAGNSAYYSCDRCNKFFSDAEGNTEIAENSWVIGALGHNMTPHAANAATCIAAGNSAYWSCDRCNKFFSDAEGNTEIAENSWVIAATGHTPVTDAAVAATCTSTGLTEGSHCSVCSAVLVAQTETPIDPTNHTNIVNDAAVAATCTETGLTAGSHCAACDTVIVAQTVVPANGHSYTYIDNGNGTHTVACANCDLSPTIESCVDENDDYTCDLCGADLTPSGPVEPVTDSAITFRDAAVSIGASLQIRFRWTKSTISASYDHYDCVVVPTKYDTSGANAYNKYQATPIVMTDESTGGTSSIYWYRDVAMYEMGLSLDCYIRCYNDQDEIVAVSNIQTMVPSEMLKATYTSANEKLKTVITDLLNMAGSAQRYFAANNTSSDLFADVQANGYVNTGFDQTYATEDYGTYTSVNSIVWDSESPLSSSTYAFSIDLIADKSPTIKYSVKKLANLEADDVRLVVTYTSNNPSASTYNRTFTGGQMSVVGTKRELRMADVAYYDADVTVTAQLYYQDQLCCTAQYSVTTGIMATLPLTSGNQYAMFDAIAKFGVSARRFTGFGSQS